MLAVVLVFIHHQKKICNVTIFLMDDFVPPPFVNLDKKRGT
jgi:hypothetical protein